MLNNHTATVQFENILQRGAIKIEKAAEGESDLSGFAFEITGISLNGTEYTKTFETDKNGLIEVKDLLVGEYTIKEMANKKAKGYILPKDQCVTVRQGETAVVKMQNKKVEEIIKPNAPKTGDDSSIAGLLILLLAASIALVGTIFIKTQKSKKS